jgi:multidrug resistance efflux pump
MVFGDQALGMDLLAERRADAGHDAAHRRRDAAPAGGPRFAAADRLVANYKETQLTHVAIGQRAEIRVDTFPGIAINAIVDSIAPASGAQFSLLPPDNATGNFTKVVQRIPVKLRISPDNPLAGKLRPGMSVVATILTDTPPPP